MMISRVARVNSSHPYLGNDPSSSLVSHRLRISPWLRFSRRESGPRRLIRGSRSRRQLPSAHRYTNSPRTHPGGGNRLPSGVIIQTAMAMPFPDDPSPCYRASLHMCVVHRLVNAAARGICRPPRSALEDVKIARLIALIVHDRIYAGDFPGLLRDIRTCISV